MSDDPTVAADVATLAGNVISKREVIQNMAVPRSVTNYKLRDLLPGCAYQVEIVASSSYGGKTLRSEPTNSNIATLPEAVLSIDLECATTSSLSVRWDTAGTPGLNHLFYKLAIQGVGFDHSLMLDIPSEVTTHEFANLPEPLGQGREYNITIVVVAKVGDIEVHSEAADSVFSTLPAPPSDLWASSVAEVSWTASPSPLVSGYRLTWKSTKEGAELHEAHISASSLSCTLTGLNDNEVYRVSVVSVVRFDDDAEGRQVESVELKEELIYTEKEGLRVYI